MANKEPVTLRDIFLLKLRALYDIEHELVKALPKMAEAAADEELAAAFVAHLEETKNHVRRLVEIFQILLAKPSKLKVEAIRGLIKDTRWVMTKIKSPEARDASLIAVASYIEHYEMAGYIAASNWARVLGVHAIAEQLDETLAEERAADDKMAALARTKIIDKVVSAEPTS